MSCKQCHQNFPHPADWKNKELHANAFHKAPSSCALCHGDDWKGGKTPSSCQQCHSSYPHPKEWSLPTNHGKAFVETETKANCFGCHDTKKLEKTATDCTACHVGFPHMKGHKLPSMTYDGKCLICHRNYTENMPKYGPKGGCLKCHDGTLEIHWREEPEPNPNQVPADPPPPAPLDHAKVASPSKRKPSSAVKMKKTPAAPQQ